MVECVYRGEARLDGACGQVRAAEDSQSVRPSGDGNACLRHDCGQVYLWGGRLHTSFHEYATTTVRREFTYLLHVVPVDCFLQFSMGGAERHECPGSGRGICYLSFQEAPFRVLLGAQAHPESKAEGFGCVRDKDGDCIQAGDDCGSNHACGETKDAELFGRIQGGIDAVRVGASNIAQQLHEVQMDICNHGVT